MPLSTINYYFYSKLKTIFFQVLEKKLKFLKISKALKIFKGMTVATYSSNKKRHVIICLTVQCHLNNVRMLRLPLNHGWRFSVGDHLLFVKLILELIYLSQVYGCNRGCVWLTVVNQILKIFEPNQIG